MLGGDITCPIELFLITYAFGISLAYWAGRESGRAKEQRIRRVHVDDAFRRGKQSGYAFLDTIDVARTEAMSSCRVTGEPWAWGAWAEQRIYDWDEVEP